MNLTPTLPVTESFRPEYLEFYGILPIEIVDGALRVAAAGTPSADVIDDLENTFGARVELLGAERADISAAIRNVFSSAQSTEALARSLSDETPTASSGIMFEADARDLANQPPVVKYVNLLIREAFEGRASDIHVESMDHGVNVRFRIDGVLTAATAPPRTIQAAVISRLKLIADLDIAERRVPQDGRIRIRLDYGDLDLRVSTVPTLRGESIVLRLLDHGGAPASLDGVGMPEAIKHRFAEVARRSHGLVLATGPTGSGKTTTLYAALRLRDAEREKIITVEEPIEYRLDGVTQVPVNTKAGVTFASSLRSILRQDPDVVMVGEMRDAETAHIAVQAAMTGHLVFSTLHTNDAASAVIRLVDLGIEPYLIAATLHGVLAQRLVRRICSSCGERVPFDPSVITIGRVAPGSGETQKGVGCALCRHTGFRGRLGIFEFLSVTDAVRSQIVRAPDAHRLRELAREEGFEELATDGYAKVQAGLTTAGEVLRAVSR